MAKDEDDDDVPHIGHGRFLAGISFAQIVKILMLIVALVAVIVMRNACAKGVSNWFNIVAPPVVDGGAGGGARR